MVIFVSESLLNIAEEEEDEEILTPKQRRERGKSTFNIFICSQIFMFFLTFNFSYYTSHCFAALLKN